MDDAVHLATAVPALFSAKNPGLAFQVSSAHVESGHDEGGFRGS
jgi:hypothetical protein